MNESIIDIDINPREQALLRIGASRDEFSAGLQAALKRLANKPRHKLPAPTDIPIEIQGQERRLGEVAVIRIRLGSVAHPANTPIGLKSNETPTLRGGDLRGPSDRID